MSAPGIGTSARSTSAIYIDLEAEKQKNSSSIPTDELSRGNSFAARSRRLEISQAIRQQNRHSLINLLQFIILASDHGPSDVSRQIFAEWRKQSETAGDLAQAFDSLPAKDRAWVAERLPDNRREELFSLANIPNEETFQRELLALAYHWNGKGNPTHSAILLKILSEENPDASWGFQSNPEVRAAAQRIQKTGTMGDRTANWGHEAEKFLGSLSGDRMASTYLHGASILGLATIACSWLRPLRPLAARGIYFLSEPTVAASLLLASGRMLYLQAPMAKNAAARLAGMQDRYGHSTWEDALTVLGFGVGSVGLTVGGTSFLLGGRSGFRYGSKMLANGDRLGEAMRAGWIQGDAVRRAVMDPQIWTQYARGASGLSASQRSLLTFLSRTSEEILVKGSLLHAGGRLAYGLEMRDRSPASAGAPSLGSLFLDFSLQAFPAVTLHLYRMGRGNRDYHLGPSMSHEILESHYRNPTMRETVLNRLDKGLPPVTIRQQDGFFTRARREFAEVKQLLGVAEGLAPLMKTQASNQDVFLASNPSVHAQASLKPFHYSENAVAPKDLTALRKTISQMDLSSLRKAYESGRFSPVAAINALLDHPDVSQGAIFPRNLTSGPLHRELMRLARISQAKWEQGQPRPLEGVLVAVKDIFPGADGTLMGGSKTGLYGGNGESPVVQSLLELGAIPIPVGMVAAANGGSGLFSGFGYVPHPTREGYDPAGSSNATAYVVAKPDIPILIGIGTDTGGSVTAPAGAVGLFSIVPPSGLISTKNMIPFATFLDRVGVMSVHPKDGMNLARLLAKHVGDDPHAKAANPGEHFRPASFRPRIVYSQTLLEKMETALPGTQAAFEKQLNEYRERGHEVIALGKEWNFIHEVPRIIYPWDAYVGNIFTHTNPVQGNHKEPPRETLDENNLSRYPLGRFSLEEGYFDRAREASQQHSTLIQEKLGTNVVLISPSPQAVSTQALIEGKAGDLLDLHDDITMAKNRIARWGQVNIPSAPGARFGITLSGELPDLVHVLDADSLTRHQVTRPTAHQPLRFLEIPSPPPSGTRLSQEDWLPDQIAVAN